MSYPLAGKHVSFDGRFLHGASRELARPTDVEEGYERVTFLVNVWLGYKPRGIDAFPEEAFDALTCVLSHTGSHTTASAMWTPILKDFCRRFSSPRVPRFQSPTSTPFNSASDAFQLYPDIIARMERPGQRVAVHFDVKFRRLTIATSRQGAGVTGGTPYGFTVGTPAGTPGGPFIKALNEGIKGMGPGQFRRLIVPPEYAYGNQQVRSVQTFFTHRSVSTFDRVGPFQLTDR